MIAIRVIDMTKTDKPVAFELVAVEDELRSWDELEVFWWEQLALNDWLVQCLEDRDANG